MQGLDLLRDFEDATPELVTAAGRGRGVETGASSRVHVLFLTRQ